MKYIKKIKYKITMWYVFFKYKFFNFLCKFRRWYEKNVNMNFIKKYRFNFKNKINFLIELQRYADFYVN